MEAIEDAILKKLHEDICKLRNDFFMLQDYFIKFQADLMSTNMFLLEFMEKKRNNDNPH